MTIATWRGCTGVTEDSLGETCSCCAVGEEVIQGRRVIAHLECRCNRSSAGTEIEYAD